MKALSVSELDTIISRVRTYVGARLQEIHVGPKEMGLGFWYQGEIMWLWCELHPQRPVILPLKEKATRAKSLKKPMLLFLKANAIGAKLTTINRLVEFGRVVELRMQSEHGEIQIEFRLFGPGRNIIVRGPGEKSVSWSKPLPLPSVGGGVDSSPGRSVEELTEQWWSARNPRSSVAPTKGLDVEALRKQKIKKLSKAIKKVSDDLSEKQQKPWRELGEWLNTHRTLDVPVEWQPFISPDEPLHWNISQCFLKAKESERKLLGGHERLKELKSELAHWEQAPAQDVQKQLLDNKDSERVNLLSQAQVKGRRKVFEVDSRGVEVFVGKSGKDNIALLRKAQPWDFWLHLKDMPAAHAIIRRSKNQQVTDQTLREIAQWLAQLAYKDNISDHVGERMELLVVEKRFVRPIKGDKLGRVTYHSERVLGFEVRPS